MADTWMSLVLMLVFFFLGLFALVRGKTVQRWALRSFQERRYPKVLKWMAVVERYAEAYVRSPAYLWSTVYPVGLIFLLMAGLLLLGLLFGAFQAD